MKVKFKLPSTLLHTIHADLDRPHEFAAERVGFILGRPGLINDTQLVVVAASYVVVDDDHYLDDDSAGAVVTHHAFRKARQAALTDEYSVFHIHKHAGRGPTWFSRIDLEESAKFVPDFFGVRPNLPHGALVLTEDRAAGLCWITRHARPVRVAEIWAVGSPLRRVG
jgi:hypothetical protein